MNKYDLIIIGGGPAGLVASKVARGLGKTVAILEKEKLGGECTWTGCVPSKTMIHLTDLISNVKELQEIGADVSKINSTKILELIRKKRTEIYQTHTPEVLKEFGIDTYSGSPKFMDRFSVEINGKILRAKKFLLATGSSPFIPDIEGLSDINYLTNETLFELKNLPKTMVILGGGPIGIEMACSLSKLGCKITIIEMSKNILSKEDPELSNMLKERMINNSIDVRISLKLTKVTKDNEKIKFTCIDSNNQQVELYSESLFIAVGRIPNLTGLNLERIGVAITPKAVVINNKLQTKISNIYACGDIVGPYQFSHMAEYQAVIATTNVLIPIFKKNVNYKDVIWITFSDPEFASAGLNELQAREKYGDKIKIYRLGYDSIDRAKIDNNTFGVCKVICNKKGQILGAQILGAHAGELIHEIQLGKFYNHAIWDFYKPIHAYPTYSELIWHLAKRAYVSNLSGKWYIKFLSKIFKNK